MAESLGLAASVVAIVELAAKIAACCKFYIESVKDARTDLRKVLVETTSLQGIVDNLRFLLDHDPDFKDAELDAMRGPISGCLEGLQHLQRLVPALEEDASTLSRLTMRQRAKEIAKRLAWPLKRNTVMSTLSDMQRYKATMSLIICGDISRDVKTLKTEVAEVRQMLTESERMSFLNWLCSVNPSDLHNRATGQYEDGTGTWVLRHPDWIHWIDLHDQSDRCLWIQGIPGSGKTVLASYLFSAIVSTWATGTISPASPPVEDSTTRQLRQHQSLPVACIYYYCHHTRNHDETPHFLRWIITQLCRQSNVIPNGLLQLYRQHCQPSLPHLISALESCIGPYDVVFIVLDAIDESMERENLLSVLKNLATDVRFAKIRLLATSRIYNDISTIMTEISIPMSMSNPFVEEDIRKYVNATVQRRRSTTYRHLSDEFLRYACDVLISKSHGMFQWAVCQLDTIRRLRWKSESRLREALQNLPEDLYGTYERTFQLILNESPEDSQLAADALTWITYNSELLKRDTIPLQTLLSAIHNGENQTRRSLRMRAEQLLELLGCLVQVDNDHHPREMDEDEYEYKCAEHDKHSLGYVSFAHYTVREFLSSSRISTSSVAAFSPWERPVFFRTVLRLALQVDFDPEAYVPHDCNFSHYVVFAAFASRWGSSIADTQELAQLAFKYFTPDASHWRAVEESLKAEEIAISNSEIAEYVSYFYLSKLDPRFQVTSTTRAAYTLMCLLSLKQWDLASALLSVFSKRPVSTTDDNLLLTRISWTIAISAYRDESETHPESKVQYAFEGTLPEWAAVFAAVVGHTYHLSLFEFLFRNYSTSFVRQTPGILLPVLFAHTHFPSTKDGPESCRFCRSPLSVIAQIIDCGASLEAPEYQVTPLQIAVVRSDYDAVKILLAAGAKVNNAGTAGGTAFSTKNPLSHFNSLHGASPLYICRRYSYGWQWGHDTGRPGVDHDIEKLLLEYGGEEFRASIPYPVADCEIADDHVSMTGY